MNYCWLHKPSRDGRALTGRPCGLLVAIWCKCLTPKRFNRPPFQTPALTAWILLSIASIASSGDTTVTGNFTRQGPGNDNSTRVRYENYLLPGLSPRPLTIDEAGDPIEPTSPFIMTIILRCESYHSYHTWTPYRHYSTTVLYPS